jgi:hypothetical protein
MVRLPTPGQDANNWGTLINNFLLYEHYEDGTLHYDFQIQSRYDKPAGGIPRIDLASDVQGILNRANTSVQSNALTVEDLEVTVKETDTTPTTTTIGTRKGLNFIPGSNLGITGTEQSTANQVSVVIGHTDTGALPFTLQKNNTVTTQQPVLDFEGGSYVVNDGGGTRTRIYVPREYLNVVSDPRIGMVPDVGDRQHVKLQAAVDLAATSATDACVFIPPGLYYLEDQITMPETRSVRLLGGGGLDYGGGTLILYPSDLGAGKYAFKLSTNHPWRLEGMTIVGPGNWSSNMGAFPAQMKGIYCPGKGLMKEVQAGGFGSSIVVSGVGQEWRICQFGGSGYAMEWVDTPAPEDAAEGHLIERVHFTACSRAGIAIADNATLANTRFKGNGHFGTEPFAIYRYANALGLPRRQLAMYNVVFENYSFEGCGNGNIYDEPGDGLFKNITFDSSGEGNYGSGYTWPGKPTNLAAIDVGYAENIRWRDADLGFSSAQIQMRARKFTNIVSDATTTFDYMYYAPISGSSRPFAIRSGASVDGALNGISLGIVGRNTLGHAGSMAIADEPIGKYDLVETVGNDRVRISRNGAGSQIVGISAGDCAAGEICVYAVRNASYSTPIKNKSGVPLQQGSIIKPDPNNPGCGMMAANPSDGPILGRVNDGAIQNNRSGRIMLTIG